MNTQHRFTQVEEFLYSDVKFDTVISLSSEDELPSLEEMTFNVILVILSHSFGELDIRVRFAQLDKNNNKRCRYVNKELIEAESIFNKLPSSGESTSDKELIKAIFIKFISPTILSELICDYFAKYTDGKSFDDENPDDAWDFKLKSFNQSGANAEHKADADKITSLFEYHRECADFFTNLQLFREVILFYLYNDIYDHSEALIEEYHTYLKKYVALLPESREASSMLGNYYLLKAILLVRKGELAIAEWYLDYFIKAGRKDMAKLLEDPVRQYAALKPGLQARRNSFNKKFIKDNPALFFHLHPRHKISQENESLTISTDRKFTPNGE